ncbi:MAG TPA: HlyD family efflux transporter periplasmic adaptor subunit [Caulobacteraceae bacterium]|jgi:membrane fusion protein (multidrug efflux system)
MPDTAEFHTEARHAAPAPTVRRPSLRARLFALLGVGVALVAIVWFGWWFVVGQFHVTTDNAYVDADVADITPLVSGPVVRVLAVDTQAVRAGQPLVVIDPIDFQIALTQAKAQLGQAERKVRGYFANEGALSGQVAARQADIDKADAQIASAQSDLDRAQTELARRQRLAPSGAVSGDEITQAQNAFSTAKAAVESARAAKVQALAERTAAVGSKDVNTALIAGDGVATNPEVQAAAANVRTAELNLQRTVLSAPADGVVAKKDVAVGQRVQVGQALMTVVPISRVYVDANFKEGQLRHVRVGQPVTLTADLYGEGVKFHGRVVGVGGGTGAAFALIPAQNATGNWIKVVQRLPVRIALEPEELRQHPLRVGLSMKADVDVKSR